MDASATKFHHYVLVVLPGVAILVALFLDQLWEDGPAAHAVPLLLGAVLFFLVAKDLATTPKNFTDLFVYNYERPYPHELDTRPVVFGWSRRPLMTGDLVAGRAAGGRGLDDGGGRRRGFGPIGSRPACPGCWSGRWG
jgi:hypothetical protein